jgi:hypothetical protein
VQGQFGDDRPGALLFPSERKTRDGSSARATDDVFRRPLAEAAGRHLPAWAPQLDDTRPAAWRSRRRTA